MLPEIRFYSTAFHQLSGGGAPIQMTALRAITTVNYFYLTQSFFQPGTSGVNAFNQDWAFENNWLCPPTHLTVRVVNHLKNFKAVGTLIVSLWRSAHFWTIICNDGVHFSNFVHDWCILTHIPNLFIRGKAKNCIFGNGQLKFIMLALRINFSIPPRAAHRGLCTAFNKICTICAPSRCCMCLRGLQAGNRACACKMLLEPCNSVERTEVCVYI